MSSALDIILGPAGGLKSGMAKVTSRHCEQLRAALRHELARAKDPAYTRAQRDSFKRNAIELQNQITAECTDRGFTPSHQKDDPVSVRILPL